MSQLFAPEVVERVKSSWSLIGTDYDAAGKLFYSKLFGANPDLPKTDFKGVDMVKQGPRVIGMIGSAVKLLDKPDELVPALTASGVRHVTYGTTEAQYPVVGAALLETLQAALGDKFTPEVRAAWVEVYGVIQDTMVKAQNSEEGQKRKAAAKRYRVNRLVTSSWKAVGTDFDAAGALFYKNLFEIAPTLPTTLFKNVDMKQQGPKLFKMVDSAIKLLDKPDELLPVLRAAGVRHIKYGTEEAHYPIVGQALLATLQQAVGEQFDDEVRAAWVEVYTLIQDTMIEGARASKASA